MRGLVEEGENLENSTQANSIVTTFLSNRLYQIAAGVAVALIIVLVIMGFLIRGSNQKPKNIDDDVPKEKIYNKHEKYLPVFEQLTPMDASQIRQALSFENIPFESKKEGRIVNIAVPKKFADEARLKMAQLGLPEGGIVGFEIFDKAQSLGATDYDKRIQFVRAISGELSRIISHMKGINTARVQIVIPEQKPFADRIAGSSSVVLNIKPKYSITDKQIKGIMHLVASSVEDIKPEDVTVIDNAGNILSDRVKASLLDKRQAMFFDLISSKGDETKSPLELLIKFRDQLKKNYENDYNQKVKNVLATLYPMGSYLVFTNVKLAESSEESSPYVLANVDVAILLDANNQNIQLTSELKESTFTLVSSAIGYVPSRDSIVIEKGPFVNIDSDQQVAKPVKKNIFSPASKQFGKFNAPKGATALVFKYIYAFIIISIIFVILILRVINKQKSAETEDFEEQETLEDADEETVAQREQEIAIEKFRGFATDNKEKIINKINSWMES